MTGTDTVYETDALIGQDIDAYLDQHRHKTMLRFITCGSVDDGKSTLIGRLLYDSKMIFEDQLASLEADSRKMGTQGENIDFALLVDGLAAERTFCDQVLHDPADALVKQSLILQVLQLSCVNHTAVVCDIERDAHARHLRCVDVRDWPVAKCCFV